MPFRAIVIDKTEGGSQAAYRTLEQSELMDGDVDVRVTHSTVNYKDGLAITGKSPVVRRFPMIPGVDLAGVVEASRNPSFQTGQSVVLNGFGVGEAHYGGFAEKARVRADWLVPLPNGLTRAQAMAIGTAGLTAMLCVLALETFGLEPSHGPAVVTGAAGGVGSVAVAVLAKLGWRVLASTGRPEEADYLRRLGAAEIVTRAELSEPGKPLQKERWAAGVDTVGSRTLANLLAQTRYGGAIAATGLAGGMDLPATVAPFILAQRGAARRRQRAMPDVEAPRRMVAPRERSRPRHARRHDDHDPLRPGVRRGGRYHERQIARSGRGGDRMSVAFQKEPLGDLPEDLPERPISPHRNLVTPRGAALIEAEARRLEDEIAALARDTFEGRAALARAMRDRRYWLARARQRRGRPADLRTRDGALRLDRARRARGRPQGTLHDRGRRRGRSFAGTHLPRVSNGARADGQARRRRGAGQRRGAVDRRHRIRVMVAARRRGRAGR